MNGPRSRDLEFPWWEPGRCASETRLETSGVNLLFGEDGFDLETGSETVKSYICRVKKSMKPANMNFAYISLTLARSVID